MSDIFVVKSVLCPFSVPFFCASTSTTSLRTIDQRHRPTHKHTRHSCHNETRRVSSREHPSTVPHPSAMTSRLCLRRYGNNMWQAVARKRPLLSREQFRLLSSSSEASRSSRTAVERSDATVTTAPPPSFLAALSDSLWFAPKKGTGACTTR